MMRIGHWLKEKRKQAGKSQLETAIETYVSVDTIRKIEQDSIYPRTNHFEKLCLFFGVTPSDYYCRPPASQQGQSSADLPQFPPKKHIASNTHD